MDCLIDQKYVIGPANHVLYKLEGLLGWYELEISGLIAASSQLYPVQVSKPTTSVVL